MTADPATGPASDPRLVQIVYGVSRMTTNPANYHRPWRIPIPRYFGWAQNKLSSDGAFEVTRPHLLRFVAAWTGQRMARRWSKYATLATDRQPPPSGYGLEEWERTHAL